MKVLLTYFKESGKYYSEGEYETNEPLLFKIWEKVRFMNVHPGLSGRWVEGPIFVTVPEHPHEHPHFVRASL